MFFQIFFTGFESVSLRKKIKSITICTKPTVHHLITYVCQNNSTMESISHAPSYNGSLYT